jgi:hypothetical protein
VWQDSEAGRAVRDLGQARRAREQAERAAENGGRWRDRHVARKETGLWAQRELDAQQRWDTHVAPMIARLDEQIARHQSTLQGAATRYEHQQAASQAVIDHGLQQQRQAKNLARTISDERNQLDGLPTAAETRQAAIRAQQIHAFEPATRHEPPAPPSPGIEM